MSKSISAEKAARKSERRRQRNKAIISATRTHITRTEKLAQSKDTEAAQKELATAISVLDKAAKKKVIHPNTAARRKSRLTKRYNKAIVADSEAVETTTKTRKRAKAT